MASRRDSFGWEKKFGSLKENCHFVNDGLHEVVQKDQSGYTLGRLISQSEPFGKAGLS